MRAMDGIVTRIRDLLCPRPDYVAEVEHLVETSKTKSVWLNAVLATAAKGVRLCSHEPRCNGIIAIARAKMLEDMRHTVLWAHDCKGDEQATAILAVNQHQDAQDADFVSAIKTMRAIASICSGEAARQRGTT